MTPKQRHKAKVKERIRLSNQRVLSGLEPDPWVIAYREKNNKTKANWKSKQPKRPDQRKRNLGSFKKGLIPKNKLTSDQKAVSKIHEKIRVKKWQNDNREWCNTYRRNRRKNDLSYKIAGNLRKRLSFLVRHYAFKKSSQTLDLLGCTIPEFLIYLQGLFSPGMSFDNYGEWHIDHKKPCASFDLTIVEEQSKCFHYTNLQPLWAIDNLVKNKYLKAA